MRWIRFSAVAVSAGAIALASVGAASASSLPSLLVNTKCGPHHCRTLVGIFKVRPLKIELSEAAGGEVTVSSWSSWTGASAAGTGTAVSSGMGHTTTLHVDLSASRARNGRFTRLTLTATTASGSPDIEKLHLTLGSTPAWVPVG